MKFFNSLLTDNEFFSTSDYQLLRGVLKNIGVTPQQDLYQDLLQEGAIILLKARQAKAQQGQAANYNNNYYFQLLRWRLLDILRRQQRVKVNSFSLEKAQESDEDSNPFEVSDPHADRFTDDLLAGELAKQLWQTCTPNEQLYLSYRLQDLSMAEIAQRCGVTRQTIYNWRKSLMKKMAAICGDLADEQKMPKKNQP
ncbi:sigma-70 family RNA polymerase sigma factor [Liquorilactobacillus sicerae]|uniref:sigma-70 family RNA polymerase sigma factor n=1 Tax=Liquorilactobacillus sicerae TaxID=1416943 RepID=UPI0024801A42|nr:sigma-70 family RNA polymerase sigma factor [Liquorilactobacillus sicerae]